MAFLDKLGLTLLAIGFALVLLVVGTDSKPFPASTWDLIVQVDNGDEFVVDYGLSKEDCAKRANNFSSYPIVYCERKTSND